MNKKSILFAIHNLDAGGAQKSLVSLLNSLPLEKLKVDLMAIDPTGIFKEQIPLQVNFVDAPKELICKTTKIKSKRFWQYATPKLFLLKLWTILRNHLRSKKSKSHMSHDQFYNFVWRNNIPNLDRKYDIAISYLDSMNYYVIDHVKAKRKILWCHSDYNKLEYKAEYDEKYYREAYKVCTISDICKKSLVENFPNLKDKFEVIENISSARIINAQAKMYEEMERAGDGFAKDRYFKIVSVGRLSKEKGFDYAVDAAKNLKAKGFLFSWYVLGEGPLRKSLEEQAENSGVEGIIKFIGVRSNPYPYIKNADLYVMPSRYEGKSIALDEAKILCKPIVVTNYPTVNDAIEDGHNGCITEISADSIANGIMRVANDNQLQKRLIKNLQDEDCSNEKQVIDKFLNIIQ